MIKLEFKNHTSLMNVNLHHESADQISFFIDDYRFLKGRYEINYSKKDHLFHYPVQAYGYWWCDLISAAIIKEFDLQHRS